MDKFVASNGHAVDRYSESLDVGSGGLWIEPWAVDALREFFRAERDEELGRWRWALDPDYVVYPRDEYVQVLHEPDGRSGLLGSWTREQAYKFNEDGNLLGLAAEAYFEAHPEPEPKPWHDAKPGEVWVITDADVSETHAYLVDAEQFYDSSRDTALNFTDSAITSARRIWPEDAS